MKSDQLITLMGSLGAIANAFSRIFWCTLFDYLSFRKILTIINSGLSICCLLCILLNNQYVYMVIVITSYILVGSIYGLFPAQTAKMCGSNIGSVIYPFAYMGLTLSSITQFVFHEAVIRKWGNQGFKVAFIVFGCFQLCSFFMVLKFRLKYVKEDDEESGIGEKDDHDL